jgi:hypothetical protein
MPLLIPEQAQKKQLLKLKNLQLSVLQGRQA